jgi:hypothetical protein
MTAAAGAAQVADRVPDTWQGRSALALTVVVAGGLVEGAALGILQGRVVGVVLDSPTGAVGRRWATVTLLVAGLGWAAASAPSVYAAPDSSAAQPPTPLVLLGAAGLGAAMGAVLGLAQAAVLRGRVAHPARWVGISTVAWTPTMAVIFTGATLPSAGWPWQAVVALGAVTGLAAGTLLGLLSGPLLPRLDGVPRPQPAAVRNDMQHGSG